MNANDNRPTIHGFSMAATVRCGCGHPEPVHVPFIAGMNTEVTCGHCEGVLFIAMISYNMNEPQKMALGVAYKPPLIVKPQFELLKQ